jgi:hypothetical protein
MRVTPFLNPITAAFARASCSQKTSHLASRTFITLLEPEAEAVTLGPERGDLVVIQAASVEAAAVRVFMAERRARRLRLFGAAVAGALGRDVARDEACEGDDTREYNAHGGYSERGVSVNWYIDWRHDDAHGQRDRIGRGDGSDAARVWLGVNFWMVRNLRTDDVLL